MPVAAVLDRGVERDRVRAGLGLVGHLERDRHRRLPGRHGHVGDAVLARAAEVGPQRHRRREGVRVVVQRRGLRDVGVPGVVGREHRAAADERAAARGGRRRARAALAGRRLRSRGGGHAHGARLRAALAAARPHGVAVSHARRDPAVGPRGPSRTQPPRPPTGAACRGAAGAAAADDVAGLAARAVLPGQLDRARHRDGPELARRLEPAGVRGRREQQGEEQGGEDGAHGDHFGAIARFPQERTRRPIRRRS